MNNRDPLLKTRINQLGNKIKRETKETELKELKRKLDSIDPRKEYPTLSNLNGKNYETDQEKASINLENTLCGDLDPKHYNNL